MSKIIENFSLDEVIGSGQYGKVYKAHCLKTYKIYAIKSIKIAFLQKLKLEHMVQNEAKTLKNITSPYIVRFFELRNTLTHYYFIYEYCNGGTLETFLRRSLNKLSESDILHLFLQLLTAFKTLYSVQVVHRDIKPSNLLFHDGIIKVADFGFCKTLASQEELMDTMVGSPLYMAPELLKGKPYGTKADVWSLGVVIYQMVYGKVPFDDKSLVLLIQKMEREEVQFEGKEGFLIGILKKMLVKNPDYRIDWPGVFLEMNLPNETKEVSENNFQLLCQERIKIQFLYEVLSEMLKLRLLENGIIFYLFMKNIHCFAQNLKQNILENYNTEAFPHLSIDKNKFSIVEKSEQYKNWKEVLSSEIGDIQKNYETFCEQIKKSNKACNSSNELKKEIENPNKLNLVFYYKEIFNYCSVIREFAKEADNTREHELLYHLNQVLETVNLHEFVGNYLEFGKTLQNQKYFVILKSYNQEKLRNIAFDKMILYQTKFCG